MAITRQNILHQGNSTITLEQHPDVEYPVVIKRSSISSPSEQYSKSLGNEFRITNILGEIKGIRSAVEHSTGENMPALVLEYVEGTNLKEYLANEILDLPTKLAIAIELTRILGDIHRKTFILTNINSENIIDLWIDQSIFKILHRHLIGYSFTCHKQHIISYPFCFCGKNSQPECRENKYIVSLARPKGFSFIGNGSKRTPAGKNGFAFAPCIRLLGSTFRVGSRIRIWEYNRPFIYFTHIFNDFLIECPPHSADPNNGCGFNFQDGFCKIIRWFKIMSKFT